MKSEKYPKTLTIYGSSDDLIEFEGIEGADEFNPFRYHSDDKIVGVFDVISESNGSGLRIHAIYAENGCWTFAIGLRYENANFESVFPVWPINILPHNNGYSTRVEIDVPEDAKLVRVDKNE